MQKSNNAANLRPEERGNENDKKSNATTCLGLVWITESLANVSKMTTLTGRVCAGETIRMHKGKLT